MTSISCLACQQPLTPRVISPDEIFHLAGPVLFCQPCGLIYFERQKNFISRDNKISQEPETKGLLDLQEKPLGTLTGEEFTITPQRSGAEETLIVSVGENRLDIHTEHLLLDLFMLCLGAKYRNVKMNTTLRFPGFPEDPRTPWQNPKVTSWSFQAWQNNPDIACYLSDEGLYVLALTACVGMPSQFVAGCLKTNPHLFQKHANDPHALRYNIFYYQSAYRLYTRLVKDSSVLTSEQHRAWGEYFAQRSSGLENSILAILRENKPLEEKGNSRELLTDVQIQQALDDVTGYTWQGVNYSPHLYDMATGGFRAEHGHYSGLTVNEARAFLKDDVAQAIGAAFTAKFRRAFATEPGIETFTFLPRFHGHHAPGPWKPRD